MHKILFLINDKDCDRKILFWDEMLLCPVVVTVWLELEMCCHIGSATHKSFCREWQHHHILPFTCIAIWGSVITCNLSRLVSIYVDISKWYEKWWWNSNNCYIQQQSLEMIIMICYLLKLKLKLFIYTSDNEIRTQLSRK